jgi:hypothetical protein
MYRRAMLLALGAAVLALAGGPAPADDKEGEGHKEHMHGPMMKCAKACAH